jgi:hypothetical protein
VTHSVAIRVVYQPAPLCSNRLALRNASALVSLRPASARLRLVAGDPRQWAHAGRERSSQRRFGESAFGGVLTWRQALEPIGSRHDLPSRRFSKRLGHAAVLPRADCGAEN